MKSQWKIGEPPSPGWYWVSYFSNEQTTVRWWSGTCWSRPVSPLCSAKIAGTFAKIDDVYTPLNELKYMEINHVTTPSLRN